MILVCTPTSPITAIADNVTDLGDFLQHKCRFEHREAEAAVFLRHRHAQNADFGEVANVLPRERAVHVFQGHAT